jgi:MoxR-like ATPase
MSEGSVTVAKQTYKLEKPFFVLATQNPLEMEGTYPLPEAQLDRFFFKLIVRYPSSADLTEILRRTTTTISVQPAKAADSEMIKAMGVLAREVPIANHVSDFVVRLVLATHPENSEAVPSVRQYVRYGVSPRGAQAMVLGAKIRALLEGRLNVAIDDIRAVAFPALRHRLILNFEAEEAGVAADDLLRSVLADVPESAV